MNSIRHMMVLLDQYREGLVAPTELLLGMQLSPAQLHLVNSIHALPENARSQIALLHMEPDSDYEDYWHRYGERVGLSEPQTSVVVATTERGLTVQTEQRYIRRDGVIVEAKWDAFNEQPYAIHAGVTTYYELDGSVTLCEGKVSMLDLVEEANDATETPPAVAGVCVIAGHRYVRRDGKRVNVAFSSTYNAFYSEDETGSTWYDFSGRNVMVDDRFDLPDTNLDLIEELEPAEAQIEKSVPAPKTGEYPRMIEGQHYMRRDGVMVQLDYSNGDREWFVENEQEERYVYDSRGRCAGEEGGDSEEVTNGRYDLVRLLTPDEVWAERQKGKDSRNEVHPGIWYPVGALPLWAKMSRHASLPDMYQSPERVFVGQGIPLGLVWNASGACVDCDSGPFDADGESVNLDLDLAEGQSSLPSEVQDDCWYWVESGTGTARKRGWLRVTATEKDEYLFVSEALPAARWNLEGIAFHSSDRGWVRMRSAHIKPATGRETLPSGARLFAKG